MRIQQTIDHRTSNTLQQGGLVVAPTDTLYGLLAKADHVKAVQRLYEVKRRPLDKACILLVSNIDDIPNLTPTEREVYAALERERPTTIVVPVVADFLPHLPRPHGTLAFRLIASGPLKALIDTTGPLLAPSANPSEQSPATSVEQAVAYFGDRVDTYVDGGTIDSTRASRIVAFENGRLVTYRD